MDYRYLKIFFILSLFFIVAVISVSIRLSVFGNIKNEERVSASAKEKISEVFYHDKVQKIDSIMQRKANANFFNGNVLVAYKGKCIYNQSFGYADLYRKEKLKNDDVFQLASVSKQFTAVAIMILKERNALSYDDSVTKFIPDFPYPRITIRMLLNHTSGLPNYYWLVEHHWKGEKSPNNEEILKMLAEHKLNLYFTPGRRWDYSNTGYIVLASVVEHLSNQSFADFMHQNVFEPLEMNNSFVYSSSFDEDKKQKLIGYYYRGSRYRSIPETVNDGAVGDKGVYSTTEDLFKWDQALYHNQLVSKETINEATSTFKLHNKYEIPYGFGFRIKETNNKKVAYHHGRWNGFRTSFMRYVQDTNTVIVLNHTSSALNYSIVREIQNVLDNPANSNITYELISSFLNEGLNGAIEYYYNKSNGDYLALDTIKIDQVSEILQNTKNTFSAQELITFKEMYKTGNLKTMVDNDKNTLKSLSFIRKF